MISESRHALAPLVERARTAVNSTGTIATCFELAGSTIELVGAGPALIDQIAPAFAHLPRAGERTPSASPTGDPDLTVYLFDSMSTGVAAPDLTSLGVTIGSAVTPIVRDDGCSFVFHAFEGALSHLDADAGIAVYAVEDASRLPPWERACPLRAILSWWFQERRRLLVHSAAISLDHQAVLLTGVGGSGKSTSALTCVADGWRYLGDDYVLLEPAPSEGAEPTVWSIYGSAKLAPEHVSQVRGLLEPEPRHPHDPPDAKVLGWPLATSPGVGIDRAEVRAIVMPTVRAEARTDLVPTSAARALLALGPPTMFQTPGDATGVFDLAAGFVRDLPTYQLVLGREAHRVPGLLEPLLSGRR